VRRTEFASLSRRIAELEKNVQFIRKLNQHIREGNGEMAAQTIRDYLAVEKRFAMEFRIEGEHDPLPKPSP
jgi:hypothetical protein